MVVSCASEPELAAAAHEEGMLTLREDGVVKIRAGMTSLEEVLRVTT
jgi:type II secretory ATPase GspE/PulE/Tfp pilus assembly ATPase PilB-like protein